MISTTIYNTDIKNIDISILTEAAHDLSNEKTVIFPTETVYGLGANALSDNAALKIYRAKNRPPDNPLIIHLPDFSDVEKYAFINNRYTDKIQKLIPGPFTFLFKKRKVISNIISGNLDTVAIRIPVHPVANELLKLCDFPVAAPSANLSGKPSPTRVKHVIEDMNGRVDTIIACDDIEFGIESTIMDLSGDIPVMLRPGPVSAEQLEEIFGKIIVPEYIHGKEQADRILAPGMKYRHYAPETPVILITDKSEKNIDYIKNKYTDSVFIIFNEYRELFKGLNYIPVCDEKNIYFYASSIYDLLRENDNKYSNIIIMGVKENGMGLAVMNRLRKASSLEV